jgi:hypothetical protein
MKGGGGRRRTPLRLSIPINPSQGRTRSIDRSVFFYRVRGKYFSVGSILIYLLVHPSVHLPRTPVPPSVVEGLRATTIVENMESMRNVGGIDRPHSPMALYFRGGTMEMVAME